MKTPSPLGLLLLGALPLIGGCAHPRKAAPPAPPQTPAASAPAPASGLSAPPSSSADAEPSTRNRLLQTIPELHPVYFSYDNYSLGEEARAVLTANAAWLKRHPETLVEVTGNCDARGTVEYNLALGHKRAQAARNYYLSLGVPSSQVATLSYGKEKPVCGEASEACWGQNRRDDTLQAVSAAVSRVPRR